MKKTIISVCAIAAAIGAVPAFATVQTDGKNDCLLYGKNCPNAVDSLPERITKLKTEIGKGEKVYTTEELKLLERKMKDENATMRALQKPGK